MHNKSNTVLPEILESIKNQLEWLVEFFEGSRDKERNKLHDIIIGTIAVRELDERDEKFINTLCMAQYVASRTASGLKLESNVINENS